MKKCAKRIGGSLTAQIFLITATILATACTLTYGFIVWATPISYTTIVNSDLQTKAQELTKALEDTTLAECGPIVNHFISETGGEIVVSDADGNPVPLPSSFPVEYYGKDGKEDKNVKNTSAIDARSGDYVLVEKKEDSQPDIVEYSYKIVPENSKRNVVSVKTGTEEELSFYKVLEDTNGISEYAFSFKGSDQPYTMTVSSNATAVNQTIEALGRVLPVLILVVLIISLLGAMIYSRYITRPIVRLSGISEKIAGLDFSWKCREKRADEIGVLGRNLDHLSDSLSAALNELQAANDALRKDIDQERELERQRMTFFSAASHELKTPITVLKGQISGMLAGVDIYQDREKYLARSLAVTNRMEGLVQEILTISRMENVNFSMQRGDVDLSILTEYQVGQVDELAQQRNQILYTEITPGIIVEGDRNLLQRSIGNLLSNALLYSPEGETVHVRLAEEDGCPTLSIVNGGAHIPKEDLPHLFEAFYRVETSRNRRTGGSGLGLYIVKMILDRHGAECRMENTPKGVRAVVLFHPQG